MPATAWAPEIDLLYAPFTSSQVSTPLQTYQTQAVLSTSAYAPTADSQYRAARAFMDALGGELRPDVEAERAFAAVRAQRVRKVTVDRRRSGPPARP